ncbi:MAG: hypothetical protein CJBNEKGG_02235 [Prosthecobacter sp.]|nr:hypothetical protein [Prosthecobacter sp.]
MKTTLLLSCIIGLGLAVSAAAQEDTAHHRQVYQEVNANEASFKKVTAAFRTEASKADLTGWFEGNEARKIIAVTSGEDAAVTEYYLEGGEPLFVFNTFRQLKEDGSRGPKVEERLYFKEGAIFKWLTTEKPAPVFHGEDYQATTEKHATNCAAFVAALNKARSSGRAGAKVTVGVFAGIEEGDYFHWNMQAAGGEEVSYFILHPDASVDKVLEDPAAYVGRRCRVTWKKGMEDIPEAGGKMQVEQILSVQWLKE